MSTKAELRRAAAAAREAIDPRHRAEASQAVAERIVGSAAFRDAQVILVYAAMRGELDPAGITSAALAAGRCAAFPQVDWSARELSPVRLRDLSTLRPGRYGVPELPGDDLEPVPAEAIDLVLVPGLAFDRRGYRLGYGGGFYDRLLPRLRAVRLGLAFAAQIVDCLPSEAHDVRMTAVVTEAAWLAQEE